MKKIILALFLLLCIFVLLPAMFNGCYGGHARHYGNTERCTICSKPATHRTDVYGFCDKHWQDAIS